MFLFDATRPNAVGDLKDGLMVIGRDHCHGASDALMRALPDALAQIEGRGRYKVEEIVDLGRPLDQAGRSKVDVFVQHDGTNNVYHIMRARLV